MRCIEREEFLKFNDEGFRMDIISETDNAKILNCNIRAGSELPLHNHEIDGELLIVVLEGEGEFLGAGGVTMPARPGDALTAEIREPHGLRAIKDLRAIIVITPPI